jgi:hypothetical protein
MSEQGHQFGGASTALADFVEVGGAGHASIEILTLESRRHAAVGKLADSPSVLYHED